MRYHYKVIESESPDYPVGMEFISKEKMHDDRTRHQTGKYSDKNCNPWTLTLLKSYPEEVYNQMKESKRGDPNP
ncbi:hypothetical protein ACFL43_00395 [Thermodesulfobacteriota bacterium]